MTPSASDAADAMQEAMIAVVRGLGTFDGQATFSTWVYRVATNACLDELRRKRRRAADSLDAGYGDDGAAQEPTSATPVHDGPITAQMVVRDALAKLPEEYRAAVVLRDIADLDYQEISESLGVPVGTVKSRIARGRSLLAGMLGNQLGGSERPTGGAQP
jgi:RNA polymerase sigma-70 factor, ECF subfamily